MEEIYRILRPGGTAFVTAWATRQPKKTYDEPDQMIPWHVHPQFNKESPHFERFYHFFVEHEMPELIENIEGFKLVSESWAEGNWECIFKKEF